MGTDQRPDLADTATATLGSVEQGVAPNAPPVPQFTNSDLINGRYEVKRVLGKGGMGVVYDVRDRMFQLRPTALKTMRRLNDGEWLDLFRAEFIVLSELNHPNVAKVYEFAPLGGDAGHCFTMELVEGQTLRESPRGTPGEVWRHITQMAEALAYLHSRDILHLDVKPDNAVLMGDGTCKLLDFGLVGLAQKPGRVAGTLAYMDPLLFRDAKPSVLSDLYCLGISALELLTAHRPHATAPDTAAILEAMHLGRFAFTTEQLTDVPKEMRECLLRLCADHPHERYASASQFLDAAAALESGSRRTLTVSRSAFIGRHEERQGIAAFGHRRLRGDSGPVLCIVQAPSGTGKSRLMAGIRHEFQAAGHLFLQGDAYDLDVGEFTALTPVFLTSAQLLISIGRRDLVDDFLPELVKMTPEFAYLYGAVPSLAYSHGEAERERISHAARDYLLAVSRVTPFVMYLNDLQWAAQGTIDALKSLVDALAADASSPLVLFLTFRSDATRGRPIEGWLSSLEPARTLDVRPTPLAPAQVQSMMSSMFGMPVSEAVATKMHAATGGVPVVIDEATRWLVETHAVNVEAGEIVASADLRWPLAIDEGISSRIAQQSAGGHEILKVLAICARPIALEHLCSAAQRSRHEVIEELDELEQAQLVTPVASIDAMYALDHDRVRESLYGRLSPADRLLLHARVGDAFLQDFRTTGRNDVAVFAAVHLNQTPLPSGPADRLERCDLNLDAALSARSAGDFGQALTFIDAAEAAASPGMWREHQRAMRLTLLRATTLRSMQNFEACVAACNIAIAHAANLIEEGRFAVPKMESLGHLRRHMEVLDTHVSFLNRANPEWRLPRHPGGVAALFAAIRTRRLVRRLGVAHLMRPMDPTAQPRQPRRCGSPKVP